MGKRCPKCGSPVQSETVTGPEDRTLSPCGDVIPTGMDLEDEDCAQLTETPSE